MTQALAHEPSGSAYPLSLPPYPLPNGGGAPPPLSEYTAWYAMAAPEFVWTASVAVPPGRTHRGVTEAETGTWLFQGSFVSTGPLFLPPLLVAPRPAGGETRGMGDLVATA